MKKVMIKRFPPLGYAANEAVNTLCTNLSFAGADIHKIMVTSCHANEGKSTIAMNMLRMLSRFGKSVVLVDCDLRRSVLTQKYRMDFDGTDDVKGLSHVLAGLSKPEEAIYQTNLSGAFIVPVGREVSNPLPLLNSARFGQLLDALASQSDYVLLDAPPVGLVIDAAQIARNCDGSLIVVDYNAVRRQELIDVKNQLEQSGTPILGTVLNKVEMDSYLSKKHYYGSYYYSSYGRYDRDSKQDSKPNRKKAK